MYYGWFCNKFKVILDALCKTHLTDWSSFSSESESEWLIRVGRPAFGRRRLEASYSFPHQASPETHPPCRNKQTLAAERTLRPLERSCEMWRWGGGGRWEWGPDRIVRAFFCSFWLLELSEASPWSTKRQDNRSALLVTHNQSTRQICVTLWYKSL